MFTCGPAFFKVGSSGPLPPSPTTQNMDYVYKGQVFVVVNSGLTTNTLDYQLRAKPFFVQ